MVLDLILVYWALMTVTMLLSNKANQYHRKHVCFLFIHENDQLPLHTSYYKTWIVLYLELVAKVFCDVRKYISATHHLQIIVIFHIKYWEGAWEFKPRPGPQKKKCHTRTYVSIRRSIYNLTPSV